MAKKKEVEKKEVQKEDAKERIKCSKCGSTLGYLRIKDKIFVCRSCGFEEEKK